MVGRLWDIRLGGRDEIAEGHGWLVQKGGRVASLTVLPYQRAGETCCQCFSFFFSFFFVSNCLCWRLTLILVSDVTIYRVFFFFLTFCNFMIKLSLWRIESKLMRSIPYALSRLWNWHGRLVYEPLRGWTNTLGNAGHWLLCRSYAVTLLYICNVFPDIGFHHFKYSKNPFTFTLGLHYIHNHICIEIELVDLSSH